MTLGWGENEKGKEKRGTMQKRKKVKRLRVLGVKWVNKGREGAWWVSIGFLAVSQAGDIIFRWGLWVWISDYFIIHCGCQSFNIFFLFGWKKWAYLCTVPIWSSFKFIFSAVFLPSLSGQGPVAEGEPDLWGGVGPYPGARAQLATRPVPGSHRAAPPPLQDSSHAGRRWITSLR